MKINNVVFYNSLINFGARSNKTKKQQNSAAKNSQPQLISAQVSQRNLTPEEKAKQLQGIKDNQGFPQFSDYNIGIISNYENKNFKKALELAKLKKPDGSFVLNGYDIKDIAKLEDEEFKKALKLIEFKNPDGSCIFDGYEILKIAGLENEAFKRAIKLIELKKSDGRCILSGFGISEIAQLEQRKFENALKLTKFQYPDGSCVFDVLDIMAMAELQDEEFIEALKLAEFKNPNCTNMFCAQSIIGIVKNKSYERVLKLTKLKTPDGSCIFNGHNIEKIAQSEDSYQRALELIKLKNKIKNPALNENSIREIATIDNENLYNKAIEIVSQKNTKGESLFEIDAYSSIDLNNGNIIQSLYEAMSGNVLQSISSIIYDKLQHNGGKQIKLISNTVDFNTRARIQITQTIENGVTSSIERMEKYSDGTYASWYIKGKSLFNGIINFYSPDKKLKHQTEIIYDEKTKEPIAILHTKESKVLKGTWDKTLYQLSDYDENYDVLEAIEDGSIKGGTKLSGAIKNPDGTITYSENIDTNGTKIHRKYTKGTNGIDYSYSYQITDETGRKILDTQISFAKDSENQTTTIINGSKYIAKFDDNTKTINLIYPDGTAKTIDIAKKTRDIDEFYEIFKNLPFSLIEALGKIKKWNYIEDNIKSCLYVDTSFEIDMKDNISIIAHELGHKKDCVLDLEKDPNLIKIYTSEIKEFNSRYTTEAGQKYIKYFSQTGGTIATGLAEVIAETNTILLSYGHNITDCESRAQFLAQNFPKTIAYIADKFGLNQINQ